MASPSTETTATVGVPDKADAGGSGPDIISVDFSMILWTWVTFLVMTFVLIKVAWRPILKALEKREETIQKSLDDAEQLKREMAELDAKKDAILQEAEGKARDMIAAGRKAAEEAAATIQAKAREESQIMVENARRDIRSEEENARDRLRKETADLAIQLASKVLESNLDTEKNRALNQRLIEQL